MADMEGGMDDGKGEIVPNNTNDVGTDEQKGDANDGYGANNF
jgi:hypothetical protein